MNPQDLLRRLVEQIDPATPAKIIPSLLADKEVLFELQIGDKQYYLICCHQPTETLIHLSPREHAIAELVAQGLHNRSISQQLGISPWTVATYIRRIFNKLNVNSRVEMVARLSKKYSL